MGVMGDNDPVDVVEIGSATLEMGGVYPVKIVGVLAMIDDGELDWKMIAVNSKDPKFAPWHDIPLKNADGTVNFICEIPKETSAKMEVATDEPKNPIKQDTKKGKLRFYPYNINWNYGLIPQTWEDPGVENADLKVMGDNDPVDVVEIGSATLEMGGVYPVKIVGVLAMIDDGELDWKMIAVNSKDPKFASVNDVADVER